MKYHRDDIPKGQLMFLNPPNIQLMMCGLATLPLPHQDRDGLITLTYSDGTTETRQADFPIESKTCFEVVSFVQAGRKEGGK